MEEHEEERNNYGTGIGGTLVAIIIIYFLFKFIFPDKWMGFYYPDENNLFKYTRSRELKSLEACREWVNTQETRYNPSGYGFDYECGKNCKLSDSGVDIYHCDETEE